MDNATYLLLILLWSLPPIILQWLIGGDLLLQRFRVVLLGILLPTIYFTAIDSFALNSKMITLNPNLTTGLVIPILNTPIERFAFFLATNTLIVQTLVLLMAYPFMRDRMIRLVGLVRRGRKSLDDK